MDSKIVDGHRLTVSNNIEIASKTKGKAKVRKELWEKLCAVYENENGKGPIGRPQHEQVPDCSGDAARHAKCDLKLRKKTKSRHAKKPQVNENGGVEQNTANEKDKERHKSKELERHKKILDTTLPEEAFKDRERTVPSVIVLHKYKKNLFNTQTEPCAEQTSPPGKSGYTQEKNRKKTKVEHKSDSQENILLNFKNSCNNKSGCKIGVEDKLIQMNKEESKDKIRKMHDRKVVYKTVSTNLEQKLRKKRKKLDRQMLKEAVKALNASEDIYDKIKTLPIKLDENQLIFMHPSHIAKALEHCKEKKLSKQEKVKSNSTYNELNESMSRESNKKKENTKVSSTKLGLKNHASSKRLRILSSLKKMRRSVPRVLEEKSDVSFVKVSKHKIDLKKRRSKLLSAKKRSIQDLSNGGKEPRVGQNSKMGNHLISENYSKQNSSVTKQNVSFGENPAETINKGQNDKMCATLNGSLKFIPEHNNTELFLKNCSGEHKSKNILDVEQRLRKNSRKDFKKLRKVMYNNVGDSENQTRPLTSEDDKKLSFQIVKTNTNPKSLRRLRKNVYSVSDRHTLMASEENTSPALQDDKLYVTKRMLFYSNKETSTSSKESLNIAIRRDTEISNNGSSNILNVVIKQKKNSVSSTKSAISPILGIENHCTSNTESLEKMLSDKCLNNTCDEELKSMNKRKQLKEAECQTEANICNADDSNEGGGDEVPTQSFQLSNNSMKKEFRNFLLYHFQNRNPSFGKNCAVNNNNDKDGLNKKQIFQPGLEKFDVHSKCDGLYSNFFTTNMNALTQKNQNHNMISSGNMNSFNTTTCNIDNCTPTKKSFYRVVNSNENDLQKMKNSEIFCRGKISTSVENKNGKGDKEGIPKTNLKIIEDYCPKSESEKLAEKLKSIGLSDKRSFIKVINSNCRLEYPNNYCKVDFRDVSLEFKSMKNTPNQKDCLSKHIGETLKGDLKKAIDKMPQNQFFSTNRKISPRKLIQTSKVNNSLPKQQVNNSDLTGIKVINEMPQNMFFSTNHKISPRKLIQTSKVNNSLPKQQVNNSDLTSTKVTNEIPQNLFFSTNDKISPRKQIQSSKVTNSLSKQQVHNVDLTSAKKNFVLVNNNINTTDLSRLGLMNRFSFENTNINNFQITTEDKLKPNKKTFLNILTANDGTEKSSDTTTKTREKPQCKFEITKKTSCCGMRNFVVSEVGVQTETCDVPEVSHKNIINESNIKETALFQEKLQLSEKNMFASLVHSDSVGVSLQKKGSFIHVTNKKCYPDVQLNNNHKLLQNEMQINSHAYLPENKGDKCNSVSKSCNDENQVIDKLNAVYEFLQYLDKILKDNSFLKVGANVKDTPIGHFNSTLRCLCNNCTEICNKIEVNELINRNEILKVKKSLENLVRQNDTKNSFFKEITCEQKSENSQYTDYLPKEQNVTQNENELKNSNLESKDLKTSSGHINPFFIVLPLDEKERKREEALLWRDYFMKDIKIIHKKKIVPTEPVCTENQTYDFKDGCGEAFLEQKVDKCRPRAGTKNRPLRAEVMKDIKPAKNEIIRDKIVTDGRKIGLEQILKKHIYTHDNSGHFLVVSQSLEDLCKLESLYEIPKTVHDCVIKSDNSKSKLDLNYGNSAAIRQCLNKHLDHKLNSNSNCKSSNTLLNPVKNGSSKSKLIPSCFKSSSDLVGGRDDFDDKSKSDTNVTGDVVKNLQNEKNTFHVGCEKIVPTIPFVTKIVPTIPIVPKIVPAESKAGIDYMICKKCSSKRPEHWCSPNIKTPNRWIRRMKSPFKIPFKKDDKDVKKNVINQPNLMAGNKTRTHEMTGKLMKTHEIKPIGKKTCEEQKNVISQPDLMTGNTTKTHEIKPLKKKMYEEEKIEKKNNFQIQATCNNVKSQPNIKQAMPHSKSPEGGTSQRNTCRHTCLKFGNKLSRNNVNCPHESIVIVNKNFQCESIKKNMNGNNSVEFLNTAYKSSDDDEDGDKDRNVEDRDVESDGWVPLNASNITEVENNQIFFDMDINNMTLKHVEYVQKFPSDMHCEKFGDK